MTNIVLIVTDQLWADITYHEKYPFVRTPNVDRLREGSVNIPNTVKVKISQGKKTAGSYN